MKDLTRKQEKVGPFECDVLEKQSRVSARCYEISRKKYFKKSKSVQVSMKTCIESRFLQKFEYKHEKVYRFLAEILRSERCKGLQILQYSKNAAK